MIGVYMFFTALIMLLIGFPVAFTFAGVALVFGIYSEGFGEGMEDLRPFDAKDFVDALFGEDAESNDK